MTQGIWLDTKVASPEDLKELCQVDGDCISFYLQSHQGGAGTKPTAQRLRALLEQAQHEMETRGLKDPDCHALLDPLWALTSDPDMFAGHKDGLALFRSSRTFQMFRIPAKIEEQMTVAGRFHILPLLEEMKQEPLFYVIELTKKGVRLLRSAEAKFEQIELPEDCPQSLEDVDYTAEHQHESAHGLNSGKEHYLKYLRLVDRSLRRIIRPVGVPVVVAGVAEDAAIFRSVSTFTHLIGETVPLSPDRFIASDVISKAREVVSRWISPDERKAVEEFQGGHRTVSAELNLITQAAWRGRVQTLFVTPGTLQLGDFGIVAKELKAEGITDLVNAAAVETIRHSGQVLVLPADRMPDKVTVAATLRY